MNQTLFYLPVLSVLAVYGARLMELNTRRETIQGKVRENLTLRLFIAIGTLIFVCSIAEYLIFRRAPNWLLFGLGWVCGIASFVIRRRAIAALGRFWSLHVEIRDEHEFVQTGPFNLVRHPVYFSMILELMAFALICNAWVTLIAIPFLFVPVLLKRVRIEEAAMIEKFGEAYRDYQRTTPAIFPVPW